MTEKARQKRRRERERERAGAHLSERKNDSLEEGGGLEDGLFQSHEQVEVEALVLRNIFAHARQQHQIVEPDRTNEQSRMNEKSQ